MLTVKNRIKLKKKRKGQQQQQQHLLISSRNAPDIRCSVDKHRAMQSHSASQEDDHKQGSWDTFFPVFHRSIPWQ
jgi:hypothetical protein